MTATRVTGSFPARRWAAAAVALVGVATSVLSPVTGMSLIREQLRIACAYATMGEGPGFWICADGISYLGLAASFAAGGALASAVGATVALTARPGLGRTIVLFALALFPVVSAALVLLEAVTALGVTPAPGDSAPGGWIVLVLPATALTALGVALAAAGTLARRTRAGGVLLIGGGGAMAAAAVVQVGLAGPVASAAALCIAGWMQHSAAEARSTSPPSPPPARVPPPG